MSARIFSAIDGSNPRTLKGHSAAVTDVAIIERGRLVLTTSNDGALKLWLVGASKCLKTWQFGQGTRKRALKVAIFSKASSTSYEEDVVDADVAGKAACVCLEDGSLAMVDLESSTDSPAQSIQISTTGKALTSIAVTKRLDSIIVAIGSADGIVTVISLNQDNLDESPKILLRYQRNSADVTSLLFVEEDEHSTQKDSISLLASSMDGLLYQARISLEGGSAQVSAQVETEFAGYDIDACNAVVQRGSDLYAAGKDGHLKRY